MAYMPVKAYKGRVEQAQKSEQVRKGAAFLTCSDCRVIENRLLKTVTENLLLKTLTQDIARSIVRLFRQPALRATPSQGLTSATVFS